MRYNEVMHSGINGIRGDTWRAAPAHVEMKMVEGGIEGEVISVVAVTGCQECRWVLVLAGVGDAGVAA